MNLFLFTYNILVIYNYFDLNVCLGTDSELDSGIQEKGDTTDEDIKVRNFMKKKNIQGGPNKSL